MGRQIVMRLAHEDIADLEGKVSALPVAVLRGRPSEVVPIERIRLSEDWSSLICLSSDVERLDVRRNGNYWSISSSTSPVVEATLLDHLEQPDNLQRHSRLWYEPVLLVGDQREPKHDDFLHMAHQLFALVRKWAVPVRSTPGRNEYVGPHLAQTMPNVLLRGTD